MDDVFDGGASRCVCIVDRNTRLERWGGERGRGEGSMRRGSRRGRKRERQREREEYEKGK